MSPLKKILTQKYKKAQDSLRVGSMYSFNPNSSESRETNMSTKNKANVLGSHIQIELPN